MTEPAVLVDRDGHVVTVTLNRPEKRNAFNAEVLCRLSDAWDMIDGDPEIRVAILTGAAGTFSAGADLDRLVGALLAGKPTENEYEERLKEDFSIIFKGFLKEYRTKKPLIAAVEGLALGGGFEIAIACDVIVAASNARWGFPEVRRGVVASSGALFRAPRSLPLHVAKELLLTGAETSTERLERLGVVNRITEPGGSLAAALEMAREMCVNSPTAVQQTLRAVDRIVGESDDFGWAATADSVRTNFASSDSAEGVAAFLEKRSPNWTGR